VDEVYARAVQTIREVVANTPDVSAAMADLEARRQAVIAGGDAASLRQKQRAYEARQRRSITLCVAPDDAPGEYTYEHFYEGEL
jgi:hypothetical protein